MRRLSPLLLILLVSLAVTARPAKACSCIFPTLAGSYASHDAVFSATITAENVVGQTRQYTATVDTGYKGCFQYGEEVTLLTHIHGATCGITLNVGDKYLITGTNVFFSTYSIGLCGYNRPFATLTPAEIQFLDTRFNCGDCVNSNLVSCIVDPCTTASCPDGNCVANYCGGCNAEFYDDAGFPVCTPCTSNADCQWGQVCSAQQQCRTACFSNADCDTGEVCRQDDTCGPKVLQFDPASFKPIELVPVQQKQE